ncbi:MAG: GNAT family N-acetyltransferase [Firmicutes bacterium]|nr:GNAT family N-acetyltransferase [Bacillota bacterium]
MDKYFKRIPRQITLNDLDFKPMTKEDFAIIETWQGQNHRFFDKELAAFYFCVRDSTDFNYSVFDDDKLVAQFFFEALGCPDGNFALIAIQVSPAYQKVRYAARIIDGYLKMLQGLEGTDDLVVEATVDKNNEHSKKLCSALGFTEPGHGDKTYVINAKDYRTPPKLADHNAAIKAQKTMSRFEVKDTAAANDFSANPK